MKKILFISFAICIARSHALSAQTSDNPIQIELNFNEKKFRSINSGTLDKGILKSNCKRIQHGDFYQIKIKDINMNLFNVLIDKKDSTIVSNISFPAFDLIDLNTIESFIKNITLSTEAVTMIESALAEERNKSAALTKNNLGTEKSAIELKIIQLEKLKKILEEINHKLKELKDQMALAAKEIEAINQSIALLNNQALAYLVSPDISATVSQYVFDPKLSFQKTADDLMGIAKNLGAIKNHLTILEDNYKDFKALYATSDPNNPFRSDSLVRQKDAELNQSFKKSISTIDAALSKISAEKVNIFFANLVHLENNAKREFVTLPLQYRGDLSKIKITIAPKKPEFGLQTYTAEYEFPMRRSYVGIGGAFYHASFSHDVFSVRELQNDPDPSEFEIVNEGPTNGEIGFSTLLHVGGKVYSDWLGLHGSIGPAISLAAKPQPRLAIGAGFSLGKGRNMMSFNVLHMFGYVDRKSNAYQEDKTYKVKPENVTISRLSNSWSLAVGYIYKF